MNIRDIAQAAGVSPAAVYKKVKARGLDISTLKDETTGELTQDGERILSDLFKGAAPEKNTKLITKLTELKTEVVNLSGKVEELTTKLTTAQEQINTLQTELRVTQEREKVIIEERDHLREALDREQQLHALALQKIPAALPAPERQPWYKRIFQQKGAGTNE